MTVLHQTHTVTFARESLMACWDECLPLLHKHWEENRHDDGELDPDKEQYEKGERAGVFRLYTVRDEDKKLVGYACFAVFKSFWRKGTLEFGGHSLWLDPAFRKGWNGVRFIKFCLRSLKTEGARKGRVHSHINRREGHLFKKMGGKLTHWEFEFDL